MQAAEPSTGKTASRKVMRGPRFSYAYAAMIGAKTRPSCSAVDAKPIVMPSLSLRRGEDADEDMDMDVDEDLDFDPDFDAGGTGGAGSDGERDADDRRFEQDMEEMLEMGF